MTPQPLHPRAFKTPEGRPVSIATLTRALQVIRQNPEAAYPGWNWFPTTGYAILREVRRGIHDRINRRAQG